MSAACESWLNSGGVRPERGSPTRREVVEFAAEAGNCGGLARLMKASAAAIRSVMALAAASVAAWVGAVVAPFGEGDGAGGRTC